jgi:hypothetical protein
LDADFSSTNPDTLQGNLKIYDLVLDDNVNYLTPDTITLAANRDDSAQHISLHAEMAEIDWSGKYKLTEVAQALQETINKYYNLAGFKKENISPQNWKLDASLRPSPMV